MAASRDLIIHLHSEDASPSRLEQWNCLGATRRATQAQQSLLYPPQPNSLHHSRDCTESYTSCVYPLTFSSIPTPPPVPLLFTPTVRSPSSETHYASHSRPEPVQSSSFLFSTAWLTPFYQRNVLCNHAMILVISRFRSHRPIHTPSERMSGAFISGAPVNVVRSITGLLSAKVGGLDERCKIKGRVLAHLLYRTGCISRALAAFSREDCVQSHVACLNCLSITI